MDLKGAINVVLNNLCVNDGECFSDCNTCQEAQSVLKGYIGSDGNGMGRLTQKGKHGGYVYLGRDEKKIAQKLGEYEDVGLEPEDVATAKALAIQYIKQTIAENDASKQLGREEGIDVTCICEANKDLEKVLLKLAAGYQVN